MPRGGNDVLALLEMMLRALHANGVVPAAQMKKSKSFNLDFLVRVTGVEPARRGHQILSLARLPIPPHPHSLHIISHRPKQIKRFGEFYFSAKGFLPSFKEGRKDSSKLIADIQSLSGLDCKELIVYQKPDGKQCGIINKLSVGTVA